MADVPFALAPGLVDHAAIINYSTRQGQRLYEMAVAPLKDEFDLDHASLSGFLEQLGTRASTSGWTDIISIPPDLNDINQVVDLRTRYGSITLEQVQAHAATYVNGNNRAAQDSMQMFLCIFNTLTKTAQATIALLKHEYTVGGETPQVSGSCLLKVVIRKSHVDTNATTSHILRKLGRIDKIVLELDSDIAKVNNRVNALVEELAARGETTSHLLIDLFSGYRVASDKPFVAYVKQKEQEYNDGTTPITAEELMHMASNFYVSSVEAEEWQRTTREEDQIIALEAQVKQLEDYATSITNRPSTGAPSGTGNTRAAGASRNVKPAWMTQAPKPGEPTKKVVNGKDYFWCPNHQAWVRHLPADCEGKGVKRTEGNRPTAPPSPQPEDEGPKQLKLTNALAAFVEQDRDDEDAFP
jgi:hypothetical protein